jgi:hypothetical protein
MRVGLRDDWGRRCPGPEASPFSVPVVLDQDRPGGPCGCGCQSAQPGCVDTDTPDGTGLPTLTVQERVVQFYDVDGNPTYTWSDLVSGPAIEVQSRQELNDATGQTRVTASVTMGWPTDTRAPKEKDRLVDSLGARWSILSATPAPGIVRFELEWLDQNG